MLLVLLGCATLRNLLPTDPIVTGAARDAYDVTRPARVQYTGPARVPFPIPALPVFGVTYALDLVIVSEDPNWDMHEYARIDLPSGSIWVAKDADADKHQTITAPIPDIHTWLPEVPVSRIEGPLTVTDRSSASQADLRLEYTNPRGQPVVVTFVGPMPTEASPQRNGNTMGHSADIAAVLLDLHLFSTKGDASISIAGKDAGIDKLFGVYPMKFLLAQTQAGFAIARATLRADPDDPARRFTLSRPAAGWPTLGTDTWSVSDDGWVETKNTLSTQRFHMPDGELDHIEVWQAGQTTPALTVRFVPALPDLRRPFRGLAESQFVVDIAGQEGHGIGRVRCKSEEDRAWFEILPEEPAWFATRPLEGELRFGIDEVALDVHRVEVTDTPVTP